jgi:hypothetical protein
MPKIQGKNSTKNTKIQKPQRRVKNKNFGIKQF